MSGVLKYANKGIISFTGIEKRRAFLASFPGIRKSFANTEAQHAIYRVFLREFNPRWVLGFFCRSPRHQTSSRHFMSLRTRRRRAVAARRAAQLGSASPSTHPPSVCPPAQTAALPLGGTRTPPKTHTEAGTRLRHCVWQFFYGLLQLKKKKKKIMNK